MLSLPWSLTIILSLLSRFASSASADAYTLLDTPTYSALRDCARACYNDYNGAKFINQLSCGGTQVNACMCRADLQTDAESYISVCAKNNCASNTRDIASALRVYDDYCTSNGYQKDEVKPTSVAAATTSVSAATSSSGTAAAASTTPQPGSSSTTSAVSSTMGSSSTAPAPSVITSARPTTVLVPTTILATISRSDAQGCFITNPSIEFCFLLVALTSMLSRIAHAAAKGYDASIYGTFEGNKLRGYNTTAWYESDKNNAVYGAGFRTKLQYWKRG